MAIILITRNTAFLTGEGAAPDTRDELNGSGRGASSSSPRWT
ncbi:hypothetical protein [Brachybacterium sacelli]